MARFDLVPIVGQVPITGRRCLLVPFIIRVRGAVVPFCRGEKFKISRV